MDQDGRGFPPRIADVEDIANYILTKRRTRRVGKQWAYRVLCEDTKLIEDWLRHVVNMRTKYGIQDADLYNFDETGFMMGVICHGMVGTRSDGNLEWATVITCTNGEGWSIPPFLVVEGQYHLASWYTATGLPQTGP
ncbi:hypothetical protein ACJ41O_013073 [Fusarium nematophilum]